MSLSVCVCLSVCVSLYADIAPTHVDRDADMIEHVLGPELVEKLEKLLVAGDEPKSPHPIGASG